MSLSLKDLKNGIVRNLLKIDLEIESLDALSDCVCHACARKIRNSFELSVLIRLLEPARRQARRDQTFR